MSETKATKVWEKKQNKTHTHRSICTWWREKLHLLLYIGQASLLLILQLLNYAHLYKFEGDKRKFELEMNRSIFVPHFEINYVCEKLLPDFNSQEHLILTTSWLERNTLWKHHQKAAKQNCLHSCWTGRTKIWVRLEPLFT